MCVAQLRKPRGATERHVQVSVGEVRATQPEIHPAAEGLSLALVNIQGVAERHRKLLALEDERQVTLLRGRHGAGPSAGFVPGCCA